MRRRPNDYRGDDIVVGEFLGDLDLVVYAPSESEHVLIGLPLDDRPDWPAAAGDLAKFLVHYLDALGGKYWERSG
jgi:hypothetical protein